MATRVRSYSKINLGLGIGPVRADGFHGLLTLYQTLALCDVVTVSARRVRSGETRVSITTNHPFVPRDGRNTAWKMVEKALQRMGGSAGMAAEVAIHIEKSLPVQGGMGAGSANAAAALIGLERELGVTLPESDRFEIAAGVGSDVPLFLVGGAVLGTGRGELVEAVRDLPRTVCLVVMPGVGVSTPAAFRAWDAKRQLVVGSCEFLVERQGQSPAFGYASEDQVDGAVQFAGEGGGLTAGEVSDTLIELSHAYASVFGISGDSSERRFGQSELGTSGIVPGHEPAEAGQHTEKKQGVFYGGLDLDPDSTSRMGLEDDLAESTLLSLVRTGVENGLLRNDFEEVVFPEYPSLREIKRLLMGIETEGPALYAALSGSGSALFGLYRSIADAEAAQQRVQTSVFEFGAKCFLTETLPRREYWARMFAG